MGLMDRFCGACVMGVAAFVSLGAHAQTLAACEQSVDYKIASLDPGAPPAAAVLQGVWLGSWEGGLCSALIVESVSKDGEVQAWYVFGRYSPWQISQPGKQRWAGKLSDRKLVFKGARGSADYTLVAPTQLAGIYYSNNGQYKGAFTKK